MIGDIEDTIKLLDQIKPEQLPVFIEFGKELISNNFETKKELDKLILKLRRKYHMNPSYAQLRLVCLKYLQSDNSTDEKIRLLAKCPTRSRSGVLVVTFTLSPGTFSCPDKCAFCPEEVDENGIPTQPKSYLSKEPAMLRASKNNFSIVKQINERIDSYYSQGNTGDTVQNKPIIKIESIAAGGTYSYYPEWYQLMSSRDMYYACNVYGQLEKRDPHYHDPTLYEQAGIDYENGKFNIDVKIVDDELIQNLKLSLKKEQKENETATCRVIGYTIETRPNWIVPREIKKLLSYGVTRVQIGVQTTHDFILKLNQRGCYLSDTIKAIKILKDAGLKVVVHLMPDLPGSTPELDIQMFDMVLHNYDLQFDDLKIYPTAPVEYTKIIEWYRNKTWIPYSEVNIEDLINVICHYLERVKKHVRIQRIIRDIPSHYLKDDENDHYRGYGKQTHLREIVEKRLAQKGIKSKDIRSMEVGDRIHLTPFAELCVDSYISSGGTEYHITFETCDCVVNGKSCVGKSDKNNFVKIGEHNYFRGCPKLIATFGFCRLRLSKNSGKDLYGNEYISEIVNSAVVRELHVYGTSTSVGRKGENQHNGFGLTMMQTAEQISKNMGYSKISVISGVGVREYYKNKLNYSLGEVYMHKSLNTDCDDEIVVVKKKEDNYHYSQYVTTAVNYAWNKIIVYSWKAKQYLKSNRWI